MIRTEVRGPKQLATGMAALALLISTNRAPVHAAIGHRMALTRVPNALRTNPDGWPAPKSFPRAYRSGGQPLLDTRRLSSAIAYNATARSVSIGTNLLYGRILQKGGTIRPRVGKWLLQPLAPPLSISEVRAFPKGKAAIRARYPGSFFLAPGPEGPGVYREVKGRAGQRSRKYGDRQSGKQLSATWNRHLFAGFVGGEFAWKGKVIERIAAAAKKVRIRRYNWLRWRQGDVKDAKAMLLAWVKTRRLPEVPLRGGNAEGKGVGNA